MSAKRDGGPAFPHEGGAQSGLHPNPGMTLRDKFAEAALMGFCANNNETVEVTAAADAAFRIADAMLEARQRPDKVGHAASVMLKALEAVKALSMPEVKSTREDICFIAHEAIQVAKVAGVRAIEENKGEAGQ